MPRVRIGVARLILSLAALPLASGCLAAAAGAGAAAGIYLNDQGAQSIVNGSLATVDSRARTVMAEMGIRVDARTQETEGFEYRGTRDDLQIRIELDAQGANTTMVKATARKNLVEWDKSYARSIVERIVQRS